MIARGMQRSSYGAQVNYTGDIIKFNQSIASWSSPNSTIPPITYNSSTGYFTIPNASLHDYLVTWSVSIHVSSVTDGFGESFLLQQKYGDGEVSEGCFSCCSTAMGVLKAHKIINIERKSTEDILRFFIINNGFYNGMDFTQPYDPIPDEFNANQIFNANICIVSI